MYLKDQCWFLTKLGKGVDGGLVALCKDFGVQL
jgi:hypothetical protein